MALTKDDLKAIKNLFKGEFDGIKGEFDSIQERFKEVDENFSLLANRIEEVNTNLSTRIDEVTKETRRNSVLIEELDDKVTMSYELLGDTNRRVKNLEDRTDTTETQTTYIDPIKLTIQNHESRIKHLELASA